MRINGEIRERSERNKDEINKMQVQAEWRVKTSDGKNKNKKNK